MVKEDVVEIYTLWDRLKKRFFIVRPQPRSFTLRDDVQPVTNVDFALYSTRIERAVTTVTGNGYVVPKTVPAGKRWAVIVTDVVHAAGTYDITELLMRDDDGYRCRYVKEAAGLDEIVYHHPQPLMLMETDQLGIRVENYVGSGNCYFYWLIKETNMEE